jgi:hypothetical protein
MDDAPVEWRARRPRPGSQLPEEAGWGGLTGTVGVFGGGDPLPPGRTTIVGSAIDAGDVPGEVSPFGLRVESGRWMMIVRSISSGGAFRVARSIKTVGSTGMSSESSARRGNSGLAT